MSKAARVRRLVLTHFWPESDLEAHRREGTRAFGRDVEVAQIHARYEL
jgi:ribonuclease BN (tRNA processing enzyme)